MYRDIMTIKCCVCGSEIYVNIQAEDKNINIELHDVKCPFCGADNKEHIKELLEGENKCQQ